MPVRRPLHLIATCICLSLIAGSVSAEAPEAALTRAAEGYRSASTLAERLEYTVHYPDGREERRAIEYARNGDRRFLSLIGTDEMRIFHVTAGEDVSDIAACPASEQEAADRMHRAGFTGCGYTLDTHASTRGLDVYRVPWSEASAWGFCVMPLTRFLEGA